MSIKIGDKNKVKNSHVGHEYKLNEEGGYSKKDLKFHEKHPFLFGVTVSLVSGIILLFSFWSHVVNWVENVMKSF